VASVIAGSIGIERRTAPASMRRTPAEPAKKFTRPVKGAETVRPQPRRDRARERRRWRGGRVLAHIAGLEPGDRDLGDAGRGQRRRRRSRSTVPFFSTARRRRCIEWARIAALGLGQGHGTEAHRLRAWFRGGAAAR
jgi:hypothetical protein